MKVRLTITAEPADETYCESRDKRCSHLEYAAARCRVYNRRLRMDGTLHHRRCPKCLAGEVVE